MTNLNEDGPASVQKYLGGLDYPADKQDIIKHAQDQAAPPEVISALEQLRDSQFDSPAEISKAIEQID